MPKIAHRASAHSELRNTVLPINWHTLLPWTPLSRVSFQFLTLRTRSNCDLLKLEWYKGKEQCIFACFWTPRLLHGHPGSLPSVHDLKCMRAQTVPLFNVPRGRRGTTTRVVHPYPCGTSRAGNRTRVVAWGVQSANHYTTGPAAPI